MLYRNVVKYTAVPALLAAASSAYAALPEDVATATTAAKTDGLAALGLVLGVVVAIWGLRKVVSLFGR